MKMAEGMKMVEEMKTRILEEGTEWPDFAHLVAIPSKGVPDGVKENLKRETDDENQDELYLIEMYQIELN